MSVIFPQHIPLRDCRLPTEAAMEGGSRYGPFDMHYGEYDYDPFAYDVACLGNLFRTYYAVSLFQYMVIARSTMILRR